MKRFNVNSTVKVKLKDTGLKALSKFYDHLPPQHRKSVKELRELQEKAGGYTKMQFHCLMHQVVQNSKWDLGSFCPFESGDIYFEEEHLKDHKEPWELNEPKFEEGEKVRYTSEAGIEVTILYIRPEYVGKRLTHIYGLNLKNTYGDGIEVKEEDLEKL